MHDLPTSGSAGHATRPGPSCARPRERRCERELLELDGGAGLLELGLGLVGLLLVDTLEHGLRSAVHEVLGLLEAEAESSSRTTLMTWIFLSPAAVRTTSNVSFSSAGSGLAAGAPAAAATATGAAADTPKTSSISFTSSASSRAGTSLIASMISSLLTSHLFVLLLDHCVRAACAQRPLVRYVRPSYAAAFWSATACSDASERARPGR